MKRREEDKGVDSSTRRSTEETTRDVDETDIANRREPRVERRNKVERIDEPEGEQSVLGKEQERKRRE